MMATFIYRIPPSIRLSRLLVNKEYKGTRAERESLYAARDEIRDDVKRIVKDMGKGQFPKNQHMKLLIISRPPPTSDIDNLIKYIQDGVCDGLGIQDHYVGFSGAKRDWSDGPEYAICMLWTDEDLKWPDIDDPDNDPWSLAPGDTASSVRIRDSLETEKVIW